MQAEAGSSAAAAAPPAGPAAAVGQLQPDRPKQKRLYSIDWLRTVLTVFVVVHHVWSSFKPDGGDAYWYAVDPCKRLHVNTRTSKAVLSGALKLFSLSEPVLAGCTTRSAGLLVMWQR
jgi:hypothetical protein